MPENVLPQPTAKPQAPSSSIPAGGTSTPATAPAPTATPGPTSAADYHFDDDPLLPAWARGKSAAEVLQIARGALDAFGTSARIPEEAPKVPANVAPAAPPTPAYAIDDDAVLTGRDFKKLAADAFSQYVTPSVNQSFEMAASASYAAARAHHAKDFERYGPEIQTELAKVPKQYWTLDNLDTVITLIKGRHRDEYAREHASTLAAQVEPTIRSGSGGSGPLLVPPAANNPFESEAIPAEWRQRAKQAGINERTLMEFCVANDMTPEMFWKQFEESPLQPIVAEVSTRG